MASIVHYGPFDDISRSHPTLNFIEKYCKATDSLNLASIPASAFLSPFAIFHDTKGNVHLTASHIWQWTARQSAPFSQIRHNIMEVRVVGNGDGKGRDVVYCECLAHFRLLGDEDEVLVPSFFVWTVGEAEPGEGTDGRQIQELRGFWDTGIIGRYVTELKKGGRSVMK